VNFIVKKKPLSTMLTLSVMLVFSGSALFVTLHRSLPKSFVIFRAKQAPVITASVVAAVITAPAVTAPPITAQPAKTPDVFSELVNELRSHQIAGLEYLEHEKDSKSMSIVLNSDTFFPVGEATLERDSILAIQEIIRVLRPLGSKSRIEIEGDTDSSPVVRKKKIFPSNWELSAARAASFVPFFSNGGFEKDQLKVVGYGDSRPVVADSTSIAGNARNRRIVLRVYVGG